MAMSKNLETYLDVKAVLTQAHEVGGGRMVFPTKGQAIRWRQRAYFYRSRTGAFPSLTLRNPVEVANGEWAVSIEFDAVFNGKFYDREGNEIPLVRPDAEDAPDIDVDPSVVPDFSKLNLD